MNVHFGPKAADCIEKLRRTGLWGSTTEEVIHNLVMDALRRAMLGLR